MVFWLVLPKPTFYLLLTKVSANERRHYICNTWHLAQPYMMMSSNGNFFHITGPLCGIRQSPVNSLNKGKWRGALMFSLISAWLNGWVNIREAGDLRRHCDYYDATVMDWQWARWSTGMKQSSQLWRKYIFHCLYFEQPWIITWLNMYLGYWLIPLTEDQ